MPKLPVVSGREAIRALQRAGFAFFHQAGSHVTLRHSGSGRKITVPVHGGEDLRPGTLRGILREAGLTVEGFRELLR